MDIQTLLPLLNENLSLATADPITELERGDTYVKVEEFTGTFRGHTIKLELLELAGTEPKDLRFMLSVSEVVNGGTKDIWVSNLEEDFETAIQTFQWGQLDRHVWS